MPNLQPSNALPPALSELPLDLDAATQRRLILRAARECAPESLKDLRARQLTFDEMNKELRDYFWVGAAFFWLPFIPLAIYLGMGHLWRIRRVLKEKWRTWVAESDPESAVWVAEGDIRRILKSLPRAQRKQSQDVTRELDRAVAHWSDFSEKLKLVRGTLQATSRKEVLERQKMLTERVAKETDTMTLASLQRQLQAVEGQLAARQALVAWHKRLDAAREECAQSLHHLRSRLALQAATGDVEQLPAFTEAANELQVLNARLSATQEAAEEVLQLRHS